MRGLIVKRSNLAVRISAVIVAGIATVGAVGVVSAHHSPAVGPRGPLGPNVPVSAVERSVFARRIRVQGSTAAAVQAACRQAITQGVPVVFLPAGQYLFETEVVVPGGLTLLGSGSSTLCQTTTLSQALFRMQGDHVRFTRLKLQGASLVWDQSNDTYGIASDYNQNVHIDHCELLGFNSAADFSNAATGQVDHCYLHHCLRDGMGYGIGLDRGSYVLVSDNEFSQCRHCLASNGFGARPTHWEFLHNHVNSDDLVQNKQGAVDAHPDMDGSFVVTGNLFENIGNALDIFNGSGLISANRFRYQPYGMFITATTAGAVPHDIAVTGNSFESVSQPYTIDPAINIWIDGAVVASTWTSGTPPSPPPPPMPWLQPMGAGGVLTWT